MNKLMKKLAGVVLGLSMAFGVGAGVNFGNTKAERVDAGTTSTLVLDKLGQNLSSTANTSISTVTVDKYELNYLQAKKQGDSMFLVKSQGAFISNKTAIPGYIKSVKLYTNSGASSKTNYDVKFAASEYKTDAKTTGGVNIESDSSHTFECSISKCSYFCVVLGNANNGQVLKLEIIYEPAVDTRTVSVASVSVTADKTEFDSINKGSTVSLTGVVNYNQGDDYKDGTGELTWSSNNTNVATVSDGVVTVIGNGEVKITATSTEDTSKSGSITLTFTNIVIPTYFTMKTFTTLSGNMDTDGIISYKAEKGDASTDPAINNGEIRVYQNGGLFTVTSKLGYKITSVEIGSSMTTTVKVSLDGGSNGDNQSIAAEGTLTISSLDVSKVMFTCTGTSSSSRLYVNYLRVDYKVDETPIPVFKSISIDNGPAATLTNPLLANRFYSLTGNVQFEDSTNEGTKAVTWSTNNSRVASVLSDGKLFISGNGIATITATSEFDTTKTATLTVTVSGALPLTVTEYVESYSTYSMKGHTVIIGGKISSEVYTYNSKDYPIIYDPEDSSKTVKTFTYNDFKYPTGFTASDLVANTDVVLVANASDYNSVPQLGGNIEFTSIVVPQNVFYVSYYANNGTENYNKVEITENYVAESTEFIKAGYNFVKWNTQADGEGTDYLVGATIPGGADISLYAQWEKATYTVSYDGNGSTRGSVPVSSDLEYLSEYTVLAPLEGFGRTVDGKEATFVGWTDGTTTYVAGDKLTVYENTVLKAVWEDPAKLYVKVTDASTLQAGDKIIIGVASKNAVAGNMVDGKDWLDYVSSNFTSETNITTNKALIFTLGGEAGAWTLNCKDGALGSKGKVKSLGFDTSYIKWSIDIANGAATILNVSEDTNFGRFLANVTSTRFLNYATSVETNTAMILPSIYKQTPVSEIAEQFEDIKSGVLPMEGCEVSLPNAQVVDGKAMVTADSNNVLFTAKAEAGKTIKSINLDLGDVAYEIYTKQGTGEFAKKLKSRAAVDLPAGTTEVKVTTEVDTAIELKALSLTSEAATLATDIGFHYVVDGENVTFSNVRLQYTVNADVKDGSTCGFLVTKGEVNLDTMTKAQIEALTAEDSVKDVTRARVDGMNAYSVTVGLGADVTSTVSVVFYVITGDTITFTNVTKMSAAEIAAANYKSSDYTGDEQKALEKLIGMAA